MTVVAAAEARAVESTLSASHALLGVVARSVAGALNVVRVPQFRMLVELSPSGPTRLGVAGETPAADLLTLGV